MFYVDMSPYSYYLNFSIAEVRNIGWLDRSHRYSKGCVDEYLIKKLEAILVKKNHINIHVNMVRGVHPCALCGEEEVICHDGKSLILGMSEVWIPNEKFDKYFAAPSMIFHYIKRHGYRPPDEFFNAVDKFSTGLPFNAQDVYLGFLKKYAEDNAIIVPLD